MTSSTEKRCEDVRCRMAGARCGGPRPLIDACFAEEGRIVSRGGTIICGRAALVTAVDDFFADPRGLSARLLTGIDVQGPLFRFRSVVEDRDGRIVFDGFDAAEVDADGRSRSC